MSATETNNPGEFTGRHDHGLDASRRVMMPATWRPEDKETVFYFLPWPLGAEAYILVLLPARWNKLMEALRPTSLADERTASVKRAIAGSAVKLKLDGAGRFCLPESLAQAVGIERAVSFVGRLDMFELWSPERLGTATVEDKKIAAETIKSLNI